MANPNEIQETSFNNILGWAKLFANVSQDVGQAFIGFLPNGLGLTYEYIFKGFPLLGRFFSLPLVEKSIKLCTGITILQGVAADVAYYLFRPIGFLLGGLLGCSALLKQKQPPAYKGAVSKLFYRLSGQTVIGAIMGLLVLVIGDKIFHQAAFSCSWAHLALAALIGAALGLTGKALVIASVTAVNNANLAAVRRNVHRAKTLNEKLKKAARQKAKSQVLREAQDIIQQMNGSESQLNLESFLEEEYESFSANVYKKVDRHFDYLTDRACHGDVKALKRLQELIPTKPAQPGEEKNAFEVMLERIFNDRLLFQLKDDIDTCYDRWYYRFLQKA